MAEYKQIKTRIWQDNWFLSLNPEEKLLWFFLLTYEHSHISGLFEMPKTLIEPLTKIKNYEEILNKFIKNGKIQYKDGWIYILNKQKHQPMSNKAKDNVNKSIKKYLSENKVILAKLTSPLQDTCKPLTKPLLKVKDKVKDKVKVLQSKDCEIIPNLLNDKQKHIQIVGLYSIAKNVQFKNIEHQRTFIKRNLRPAKNLNTYDTEKIKDVMRYLHRNADFKWTLETVGKYIDENLSKLAKQNINLDNI